MRSDLHAAQFFLEFVRRQLNLAQYFANQRSRQIPTRMVWYSSRPAVWVAIENMAPLLPHSHETKMMENFLHHLEIDNR